jgi:CRISPR-associated protein Csx10
LQTPSGIKNLTLRTGLQTPSGIKDSGTRGVPVPIALFYKDDKVYNRLMTTEQSVPQHCEGYLIQDSLLIMWLCSDLLLRNAHLRPSTDVRDLQKELEKHLGVRLSRRKALIRTTRTDGWHQGWGQPRPSYIGLAAGSCIVFECQECNLDKLQALMQRGLGEHRAALRLHYQQ